jgi:hypothetical protein
LEAGRYRDSLRDRIDSGISNGFSMKAGPIIWGRQIGDISTIADIGVLDLETKIR